MIKEMVEEQVVMMGDETINITFTENTKEKLEQLSELVYRDDTPEIKRENPLLSFL